MTGLSNGHTEAFTKPKVQTEVMSFVVEGTVKWFDSRKGYGFILPNNGTEDVLLHVNCIKMSGFKTVYDGANIRALVLRTPRGLKASRVLYLDERLIAKPKANDKNADVVAESGWERATVKWFDRNKGYGFLTRGVDTKDIFIHMETLRKCAFAELVPDQVVEVRYGNGQNGICAVDIR